MAWQWLHGAVAHPWLCTAISGVVTDETLWGGCGKERLRRRECTGGGTGASSLVPHAADIVARRGKLRPPSDVAHSVERRCPPKCARRQDGEQKRYMYYRGALVHRLGLPKSPGDNHGNRYRNKIKKNTLQDTQVKDENAL